MAKSRKRPASRVEILDALLDTVDRMREEIVTVERKLERLRLEEGDDKKKRSSFRRRTKRTGP